MNKTSRIKEQSTRVWKYILILAAVLILFSDVFVFVENGIAASKKVDEQIRIGVLAKRGHEICLKKWGPTAEYLTDKIAGRQFVIVPIDYEEIYSFVEHGKVDFILANSSFYVELERWYGVNRIATLKNLRLNGVYTEFAGVIFWMADRVDLRQLTDLKDKTFMAVEETSFGGWRMAWRELKEAGFDPHRDLKALQFGGTHDAVVYAVKDGTVDAGTVRTDTLERMRAEGKIDLKDFYIIPYRGKNNLKLPFLYSTRSYPEWPMAKVRHTSDTLAEEVAIALLEMEADSVAAKAGKNAGWTIPLNYQSVHNCLKELKIGPYKDLGKITLYDTIRNYWPWLLGIFVMVLIFFIFFVHMSDLKAKLKQSVVLGEERERARVFLQSIIDAIPESLLVINRDHTIAMANHKANYAMEENPDTSLLKCYYFLHKTEVPCNESEYSCPLTTLIETMQPVTVEHTSVDCEGQKHIFEITAAPISDESGGFNQFVEIFSDVTMHKKAEEELLSAKEKAEQINEAKSEFLMNVSHDIRTPMNVINGFNDLLLKTPLNEEQERFCKMIKRKGKDLICLIEDIIDISSVEKGKVRMYQYPFEIQKVVRDIGESVGMLIGNKEISFKCNVSEKVPKKLIGDSMRLKQILENLCGNAVKYTEKGKIDLTVSIDDEISTEQLYAVCFEVEDTGIGISEKNIEDIFEPYTRFYDIGKNEHKDGVGMGLHIVETLVNHMGGKIIVKSEVGKGSKFSFKLKMKKPGELDAEANKQPLDKPDEEVSLAGMNILIAEDDDATRVLMKLSLKDFECNIKFANDGEEVIEEMKKNKYDIVLMDIRMPSMDGFETTKIIRADVDKDVPVLALTAHVMGFVEDDCKDAGMNGFISKPIDIDKLKRAIKKYV